MSKKCPYHHSQYIYHSSAFGVAGEIQRPSSQTMATQGSIVLHNAGGHNSHRGGSFRHEGLVSFDEVYLDVGGSYDECHDIQTTYACSVIEGLNVADMLTADRVVSRMMVYSPPGDHGGEHSFDITGSYFENLRIAGHKIDIKLATNEFHELNTYSKFNAAYKNKAADKWLIFSQLGALPPNQLNEVEDSYHALHGMSRMIDIWQKDANRDPKDHYRCSAVNHLKLQDYTTPNSELQSYGAIICIPKFGVIRLAEMLIGKHQRSLTMFRVDMCSTTSAVASGSGTNSGGTPGFP